MNKKFMILILISFFAIDIAEAFTTFVLKDNESTSKCINYYII